MEHFEFLGDLSLVSSIVVAIVEIGGLIAIWYQLKKQKDVEVANFLLEFEKSFIEHKPIFQKIELSRERDTLTENDISGIVRYLTFYESLYHFIKKGVLSIDMIDDLFGYRFFLAMHNEFIQNNNLKPYQKYYQNIFDLYEVWYKFRLKHNKQIPWSYNKLDLESLDMEFADQIFRSGKINKYENNDEQEVSVSYEMKILREDQLDLLMDLQQEVFEEINDEEIFQLTTREEYRVRIREKGRIIGVFAENELVAFLATYFPGESPDNLGRDVGIREQELGQVAYFESLVVKSSFRGNNLQQKMQQEAYDLLIELEYPHHLATVSHKNYYSIKNMLDFKMKIHALKKKYGGKLRYIVYRNASKLQRENYGQSQILPNSDIKEQKGLLENGYVGYTVYPGDSMTDFKVGYAPIV
jgi:ribosomal protein S18 acetylase RimI-like enzyme